MESKGNGKQPVSVAMTDEQLHEFVMEACGGDPSYLVEPGEYLLTLNDIRAILSSASSQDAISNAALESLRDAVTEAANEWAGYVEVDTAPRACAAHIGQAFDKAASSLKPDPAAQIGGGVLDALTSALDCWECEHLLSDAVVEKMRHALQSAPAQPVERPDATELPPLPMQALSKWPGICYYTADQMREYALAAIAANQPQRGNAQEPVGDNKYVSVPVEWIAFLDGSGEIDGLAFGEKREGMPPYWWRKQLREAIAAAPQVAQEPAAWMVGREITRNKETAESEHKMFPEYPIIPLYAAAPQSDARQSSEKDFPALK